MDDLNAEIAKARTLCDAATPGPWKAGRPDMATIVDGVDSKLIYAGERCCAVASGRIEGSWDEVMANAAFIAASRALVPRLLAALEVERKNREFWVSASTETMTECAEANRTCDAAILAALRGESHPTTNAAIGTIGGAITDPGVIKALRGDP